FAVGNILELVSVATKLAEAAFMPNVKPCLLRWLRLPLRPALADVCQKFLRIGSDIDAVTNHVREEIVAAAIDMAVDLWALSEPPPWWTFANPPKKVLLLLSRKITPACADQAIGLNTRICKEEFPSGHVDKKIGRNVSRNGRIGEGKHRQPSNEAERAIPPTFCDGE